VEGIEAPFFFDHLRSLVRPVDLHEPFHFVEASFGSLFPIEKLEFLENAALLLPGELQLGPPVVGLLEV
jgi:hypothetical protein